MAEASTAVGCYTAQAGGYLPTYRDSPSVTKCYKHLPNYTA